MFPERHRGHGELLKNLLRRPFSLACRAAFLGVLPVLYLLERFVRIRVGVAMTYHIGHLATEPDLFLRRLQIEGRPSRTHYLLVVGPPANKTLLDLFSRHVTIVSGLVVHAAYRAIEPLLRRTRFHVDVVRDSRYFPPLIDRDLSWVYANSSARIAFTPAEEHRGLTELRRLGVAEGQWFMCFHARDSSHLTGIGYPQDSIDRHAFRNAPAVSFLPLARSIADLGGVAIRVGSHVAEPLTSSSGRIVDYAATSRSDFMDVYLAGRCRFFVGTASGLSSVPYLFDVPVAMSNTVPPTSITWAPNTLYTPKLYRSRASRELLTFPELVEIGLFDLEVSPTISAFTFPELGLEVVDNSAEDVTGLGLDMYDLAIGQRPAPEMREMQQEYKRRYLATYPYIEYAGDIAPSFIVRHRDLIFP